MRRMPRRSGEAAKAGLVSASERAMARQAKCEGGPRRSFSNPSLHPCRLCVFRRVSVRHGRCLEPCMPADRRFVNVLKSADPQAHFYVGCTADVLARLADHNAGRSPHTALPPLATSRHHRTSRRAESGRLRALLEVRLRPRLREAPLRLRSAPALSQLPVRPRPPDSQRRKARNGKSG
jgi:hypothetical protein